MTRLLSTSEICSLLAINPATLREGVNAGRIPCVRVSPRVWRFDPAAVLAALGGAA